MFLLRQQQSCVLLTVASVSGSAPRESGTCMLVSAQAVSGTIGGGNLEYRAIAQARAMLATGEAGSLTENIMLGVELGQCCGGGVTLHYSVMPDLAQAGWVLAAEQCLLAGQVYRREFAGFSMDILPRNWQVVLFGAGHVGKAVARILETLPCQLLWLDSRPDLFPADLPASIHAIQTRNPPDSVAELPAGAYYLVMTHDHGLDLDICTRILARDDAAFVGLIGSETKAARFRHRLRDRGLSMQQIAQLVCPVGVDGIDDKHPAAIAVAIMAQVLQVRSSQQAQTSQANRRAD